MKIMANNGSYLFNGGKRTAYCPTLEAYAKAHGQFIDKKHGKKGDVALFDFGKGRASHTGIVEEKTSTGYKVIEGNTSITSNDNGGKVMIRTRTTKYIRGFYRPKYDKFITADMIVSKAKAQVGTKENPAGSNKVKYNTWFYGKEVRGSEYPWCMAFVSWVFWHVEVQAKAAAPKPTATAKKVSTSKPASKPAKATVNVAKKASPKPKGSSVVKEYQHAFNVSYKPKTKLVEDGIRGEKTISSFGTVKLKRFMIGKKTMVKFVQKRVGADVDGVYGKNTKAKVAAFQRKHGLVDDGVVGRNTLLKMVK